MKISLTLILSCLFITSIFGQVGINTENPQSTLDVSADNTHVPAGIIAPRQTRQQLISKGASYTVKQRGAIVYVTDVSGVSAPITVNITQVGYYYFDGTVWQPLSTPLNNNGNNWSTSGNNNLSTTHGANYLGTIGAVDLVVKTAGTERMTVSSAGNVGIGIPAPTNKLHIKATTDPLKLEGLTASGVTSDLPLVLSTDGTVKTGAFPSIDIIPNDVGTVIAINKQLIVAQEITVLMSADYSFAGSSSLTRQIGNITNEIIDNKNSFAGTSTGNSFKVEADGVYLIMINAQLSTTLGSSPVLGIWNDTDGYWVARVNDTFVNTNATATEYLQTYSLTTAINMYAGKTYSFRASNTYSTTIKATSSGTTGSGPISFYSLKRLK